MTHVALIATDLDGTLLRPDHSIGPRTLAALAAAVARGVHVVAATGRGWRSAVPLIRPVTGLRFAVCSNGAHTWDVEQAASIEDRALSVEDLELVLDLLAAEVPDRGIFWEREHEVGCDEVYRAVRTRHLAALGHEASWTDPPRDRPAPGPGVFKVLVNHPDMGEDDLLDALGAVLPAQLTLTTSGGGLVEITAAGVHKAAALAAVCERLGVPADAVVAFGDNRNDIEMLRWAGRGVAMGNASALVQSSADDVTATNGDDGVAVVVESLLARGG